MSEITESLLVRSPDLTKVKQEAVLIFGLVPSEEAAKLLGLIALLTSDEKAWAIADDVIAKTLSKNYCLNLEPLRKVSVVDMALLPDINKLINHLTVAEPSGNILRYTDLVGFTAPNKSIYVRVSNWRVSLIIYSPQ